MIVRYKPGCMPPRCRVLVSWVYDGDTFRGMGIPGKHIIRIWGMDAPEKGQPSWRASGAALWKMIGRRSVDVRPVTFDRYGRVVARVFTPGVGDVGVAMVRGGWAWWYRAYARDSLEYSSAETEAREAQRGIWKEGAKRWAPWAFRARYARMGAPRL